MKMYSSLNVYGNILESCCDSPKTGFFRNGKCDSSSSDVGIHTVCILVTDVFLNFSKKVGNDLSSPNLEFDFPGLKAGDRWCLCALRWKEALDNEVAPPVFLESTHIKTLEVVEFHLLQQYAVN